MPFTCKMNLMNTACLSAIEKYSGEAVDLLKTRFDIVFCLLFTQ